MVVIFAFVADLRATPHDNDFPFGSMAVGPHPDLSEFFVKHARYSNDRCERTSAYLTD